MERYQNAKKWLTDKIKGLAGDLTKGLKDALGIHSPSKVMADQVGKNIVLGIAKGISSNESKAIKSVTSLASKLTGMAKASVKKETLSLLVKPLMTPFQRVLTAMLRIL